MKVKNKLKRATHRGASYGCRLCGSHFMDLMAVMTTAIHVVFTLRQEPQLLVLLREPRQRVQPQPSFRHDGYDVS